MVRSTSVPTHNDDGDETDLTGALLSNPLYGLDSDEEFVAIKNDSDEEAEHNEEHEKEHETEPRESEDGEKRTSLESEGSSDEVRKSLDDFRGSAELSRDTDVDLSRTSSMDESATKIVTSLPVRQRSVVTKVNERQQKALSKKPSSKLMLRETWPTCIC